ncbi:unnamed protein product [Gordionus sp. m RMFG-2023]
MNLISCGNEEGVLNLPRSRQRVSTKRDDWDPDSPLVFNTDEWHMKEWASADRKGKNMMRQAFRNYFTGRNSLETRIKIYKKLPPLAPSESTRDECNPYYIGVDFCGSNGDCVDLSSGNPSQPVSSVSPSTANASSTVVTPVGSGLEDYFKCECYKGWQGRFCDKDINECTLSVCQNNAYCENFMPPKRYTCTCQPYTFGIDCERTYPPSAEGFQCHSADNSSLIDWLTPDNFVLLDFFPLGRVKHADSYSVRAMNKQLAALSKLQSNGKKLGHIENMWLRTHAKRVYVYNALQPTLKETHLRPIEFVKYDNSFGWNFNTVETAGIKVTEEDGKKGVRKEGSKGKMPFEHVIEINFPEPTLIRAFVTRGGLEKKKISCDTCKRLVTKYRITFRSGARRWFKFIDQAKNDIIFSALETGESYRTVEDLKAMDITRARVKYPPNPFTAEAIRVHVLEWFPRDLQLHSINTNVWGTNKYLSKMMGRAMAMQASSKDVVEAQNPVLRFDILGCHL